MLLLILISLALVAVVLGDMYDPDSYDGEYDTPAKDYGGNATYDTYDPASLDPFSYGADGDALLEDANNYYGDELDEYYDHSGAYGDQYGEDYFFDDLRISETDCVESDNGQANVTAPACDIVISGADKIGDRLTGGVDGTYQLSGCWDGKPKYLRKPSPKHEDRLLYFSAMFKDWDICQGKAVNEPGPGGCQGMRDCMQSSLLVYGGGDVEYTRPEFVPPDGWHLLGTYISNKAQDDVLTEFPKINLTVGCKGGKSDEPQKSLLTNPPTQSLLTDEESDAKFRAIWEQSRAAAQPAPSVNFVLVILMIFAGMGVVLGLPYLLFKKKEGQSKSWAQQLEDSRKKRAGHVL